MKNNETQSLDTRAKAQSQERKKENPSTKLSHPYYTQRWSSRNPRLIVFLLDQSASMVEIYGDTGKTKADYAADIVSFQIDEFILRNKYRGIFRNRVYVVVIGYGGDDPKDGVKKLLAGNIEDLALDDKYPSIEKEVEINGEIIKIPISKRFVTPSADGVTPMKEAFELAKEVVEEFLKEHENTPAPIIINVSDGYPEVHGKNQTEYQKEVVDVVEEIRKIKTIDGATLIFNIYLGEGNTIGFEGDVKKIKKLNNKCVDFLFKISSYLPNTYRKNAIDRELDKDFPNLLVDAPKPRCFISNAKSDRFLGFITLLIPTGT